MSEKRNVPKLRFPDFHSSWISTELGKISAVIDCKHRTPPYVEEGIPVISPGTIKWGKVDLESPTKRVSEIEYLSLMDHCDPKVGDFILSRNQSVGVASIVTNSEKFVLGQDTVLVQPHGVDPFFTYYRLQTQKTQRKIEKQSGGSTFSRINLSEIRKLRVQISDSKTEQQKIAEFLTAVDQRIELLQAKKEKLEAYKKGVMQKIFLQQLRFKADDGSDFPDWEERKLGEVLDYEQPTKYLVSSTEYSDNFPTPVLTAGKTFLLGYTDETTGIFNKNLPTIIFDDFTTAFQFVDFPFKAKSSAMKMLIPKESGVNIRYVFSAMLQIKYTPGDHKRHWISEFQEFEIPYPCEDEQTKIVQFLKSLDRSIDNLNQQITHTQTWKKGLLQKMFV